MKRIRLEMRGGRLSSVAGNHDAKQPLQGSHITESFLIIKWQSEPFHYTVQNAQCCS